MTQAPTGQELLGDTFSPPSNGLPSRPGEAAKCPRCRGKVFNDHGDTYCLNCGTLHSTPRAWDPVSSEGFQHQFRDRGPCITVGCINRADAGSLCRTCTIQHQREQFFASRASV